jgi:6-phosphofructokinase 1
MRSGNPDSFDLMVAVNYGVMAADQLLRGRVGTAVALRNGNYVNVPIAVTRRGSALDATRSRRRQLRPKIRHVDGKPMFLYLSVGRVSH